MCMKIEAIKIIKNGCFKMKDLQYFQDLKILYIKEHGCYYHSSLDNFIKEFNSSNVSCTLQYLFIDFVIMGIENDKKKLLESIKVPFCCSVYVNVPFCCSVYINVLAKSLCNKEYDVYYLKNNELIYYDSTIMTNHKLFKNIYLNKCIEHIKDHNNIFYVKKDLEQLVEIQKIINKINDYCV